MTDKELLELAAKAAGMKVPTKKDYPYEYIDERGIHRDISCGGDGTRLSHWNPLNDSGHALELAVKLQIDICPSMCGSSKFRYAVYGCKTYGEVDSEPLAATRRAIVRAAAEIGRTK